MTKFLAKTEKSIIFKIVTSGLSILRKILITFSVLWRHAKEVIKYPPIYTVFLTFAAQTDIQISLKHTNSFVRKKTLES